jgi:hypothetical protein
MASLQKMASEGNFEQLAVILQEIFSTASYPAIKELVNQVSRRLGQKFSINSNATTGVASSVIPQILDSLV